MSQPLKRGLSTPGLNGGLSAAHLAALFEAGATWLEAHVDAINALNVFPIPDGDTGLNMALTLRSAVDSVDLANGASSHQIVNAVARGALMGARGNSGVILAQFLRGFATSLDESTLSVSPLQFAQALARGAHTAFAAVANPVEGTILTVARAAAEGALQMAGDDGDVEAVLDQAHRLASQSVAETPKLLPILDQAGVVDAGGEGFRVMLEGMLKGLRGEAVAIDQIEVTRRADLSTMHSLETDNYGYCTEVLVRGSGFDLAEIRQQVAALGTCALVVGDSELLKAHVHTLDPGALLTLGTSLGDLLRVKVDNLRLQHEEFVESTKLPQTGGLPAANGVVAVAAGAGFQRLYASLGARVVFGGSTMNPSVQDIVRAIDGSPWRHVVVVPNHKNVLMAAEEAARLAVKGNVSVIPTRNMAEGITVTLAMTPDGSVHDELPRLRAAAAACCVIEIARAARSARLGAIQVKPDALIAFLKGEAIASAVTLDELIGPIIDGLAEEVPLELATIYVGQQGTMGEAETLVHALRGRLHVEVEVVNGEQPLSHYIIAVE